MHLLGNTCTSRTMNYCGYCACFMCAFLIPGLVGQSNRLVNGTSRYNGRLEIFYNKTWNTVCNDLIDRKEAQVTCRMFEFNSFRALLVRTEMYGKGSGPILLDNVQCQGSETSLIQCQHNGLYKHDCFHYEDLAIICSRQQEILRLTGTHLSTTNKGRVEILLEGEWYTMCVPDVHISTVICRQLRLPSAAAVPLRTFSQGPLVSPKLLSGLRCNGKENSIMNCDQTTYNNEGWRRTICNSDSDYYGVFCAGYPSLFIHADGSKYPVMEGTKVTLKCISEHWPNVTKYTWPENAGALAEENDLIIENVNRTHNGKQVKCLAVASDRVLVSSNTFKLQVYYHPIITIQMASTKPEIVFSHHYQVTQGQNITFSCNAVSNPHPASITWSGRVSSSTGQLWIIAAEKERHNGVYTCTVVTTTVDEDERLPLRASSQLTIDVIGAQMQIQLINGTASWNGRLEILYNGTWTTVCSQYFGKEEAQVACKMLGFNRSQAMAVRSGPYGEGSGLILFSDVTCTGKQSSFSDCQHDGLYRRDCTHSDDVGIICNINPLQLRLTSVFRDIPDINRVEMELGTQWNTLCMTRNAAKVVCRQLGISRHAALFDNASMTMEMLSEQNKHPKLEIQFLCLGNETSLLECDHYGQNNDIGCGFRIINCNDSLPRLRILFHENSFPPLDGTNITLECESTQSGQSEVTYLWFEYSRRRIQRHDGKYLILNNVTRDHHGVRVHCGANYWYNDLVYLVASDTMIITVCCAPSTVMNNIVPTSLYIHDDKGYLMIEMTAYPTPHVTAMTYLGPVLTDGVKGEDTGITTHVICAATGLARASLSCNITVFNILQAADGFYKIVFENRLGQLPFIFTIRRHELTRKIPLTFLLTFIGAFAVGIIIIATVTVYCTRRWKSELIRVVT